MQPLAPDVLYSWVLRAALGAPRPTTWTVSASTRQCLCPADQGKWLLVTIVPEIDGMRWLQNGIGPVVGKPALNEVIVTAPLVLWEGHIVRRSRKLRRSPRHQGKSILITVRSA